MKKYFLIIDTSSMLGLCAVAEYENNQFKIVFEKYINAESSHSEHLFISIQEALSKLKINFSDVDTILYSSGPGSFTGLRISYSAVQGFVLASKVKSHGVSVLKALINNIKSFSGTKAVLIKGSKNDVFAFIKNAQDKVLLDEGSYEINYISEFLNKLDDKIACIGSGATFYKDELKKNRSVTIPEEETLHIVHTEGMLSLLEEAPINGINYLKASYAEKSK